MSEARYHSLSLDRVDSIGAMAEEWNRLAERSSNVFATTEFFETWWRHYAGHHRLWLRACRDDNGRLRAILPLYVWRERPLRILRFLGHNGADQLGPILADCDQELGALAMRRALADARASVLLGERLPASAVWTRMFPGCRRRWAGSPVLPLAFANWDAYLATRSSNFRQGLRRHERTLARDHQVVFRLATESSFAADWATLLRLHGLRWRTRTNFVRHGAFHEAFARKALERAWLRLWTLEVDGKPVAAWQGFKFGGVESFFQSGRDPAWERDSIGLVLMAHTIREAMASGAREYRFLRGGESYKYRFTDSDQGVETLLVGRGAVGRAAITAAAAAWSLRDRLKKSVTEPRPRPG